MVNRMGRMAARVSMKSARALVLDRRSRPSTVGAALRGRQVEDVGGAERQDSAAGGAADLEVANATNAGTASPVRVVARGLGSARRGSGDDVDSIGAAGEGSPVIGNAAGAETTGPEHSYGLELTTPPSVSWCELLGYSAVGGTEDVVRYAHRRGCVNLHMKSCHALSVLRALDANWRVQIWCEQHCSMASCRLST